MYQTTQTRHPSTPSSVEPPKHPTRRIQHPASSVLQSSHAAYQDRDSPVGSKEHGNRQAPQEHQAPHQPEQRAAPVRTQHPARVFVSPAPQWCRRSRRQAFPISLGLEETVKKCDRLVAGWVSRHTSRKGRAGRLREARRWRAQLLLLLGAHLQADAEHRLVSCRRQHSRSSH